MGVENNEAVIATTWHDKYADDVWAWVQTLDRDLQTLFARIPSLANHKHTIILGPDGSKKGWEEAEQGATIRETFIQILRTYDYEDGSSPWDWVEVGYGEFGQAILRGNCTNKYDERPYAL